MVKLEELEEDDEDDVLSALDGTAPAVRELERGKMISVNEYFSSFVENLPCPAST